MFKYHEVSRDPLFKVLVPICGGGVTVSLVYSR